jgi:hypothetical protein
MIVNTTITINGKEYDYAYSDIGVMIERDGAYYTDATDPLNSGREYTETDVPIEPLEEEATATDYQASLRSMGVKV